jgi:hypothetical protein
LKFILNVKDKKQKHKIVFYEQKLNQPANKKRDYQPSWKVFLKAQ